MGKKGKQEAKLSKRFQFSPNCGGVELSAKPPDPNLPSRGLGDHSYWWKYEMLHQGGSSRARSQHCVGDHPLQG